SDFGHLGHQVSGVDQLGIRIAAGDDDELAPGTVAQRRNDVVDVDPPPLDGVGEFVEDIQVVTLGLYPASDLGPSFGGVGRVIVFGSPFARPRPARAHFVPFDRPADTVGAM